MIRSRLVKIQSYFSARGPGEIIKDIRFTLRRSFLGVPRRDLLELLNLESSTFEINIPNYTHGNVRNASLTLNDKVAISLVCHTLKPQTVIEVGTFRGETTDLIARNCHDSDIYTLDLPSDFVQHTRRPDEDDLEVLKLRANDFYIQECYETHSRIHQLYGDSAEFDFDGLNVKFDLAFIDGAHSFDYVKNDTEKIMPHMHSGGWIVWDDYCFSFPEIIRYVNTLRSQGAFHIYGTRLAAMVV